jgi:hypothetical protein
VARTPTDKAALSSARPSDCGLLDELERRSFHRGDTAEIEAACRTETKEIATKRAIVLAAP